MDTLHFIDSPRFSNVPKIQGGGGRENDGLQKKVTPPPCLKNQHHPYTTRRIPILLQQTVYENQNIYITTD